MSSRQFACEQLSRPRVSVRIRLAMVDSAVLDVNPMAEQTEPPMSKTRQKRLAKAAIIQQKRAMKKAAAKAHKAELQAKRASHGFSADTSASKKKRKIAPIGPVNLFCATVVIDLGFDHLMTDKVSSLLSMADFH